MNLDDPFYFSLSLIHKTDGRNRLCSLPNPIQSSWIKYCLSNEKKIQNNIVGGGFKPRKIITYIFLPCIFSSFI